MSRPLRALIYVALAIGIGALVWMISSVLDRVHGILTVILVAVLFAYLLAPPVMALERRRIGRAWAVLLVYLGVLVIAAGAIASFGPVVSAEAEDLSRTTPATVVEIRAQLNDPRRSPLLQRFPPGVRDAIARGAGRAQRYAGTAAGAVGVRAITAVRNTFGFIVRALIMLALAFFFITDAERIRDTGLRLVPPRHRPEVVGFIDDVDRVIGGFVRGQVSLAAVVGVAAIAILLVMHVRYAVLLGVLTGVASVVPLVGAIVGSVPAFVVAWFTVGPIKAAIVLLLFVVVFEIQAHVLTPVVVARTIGVSPLVIFVAILVGAEAYGVLGMLLAVPIAGILRVAMDRYFPSPAGAPESGGTAP